jgi:HSP20 family protein
MSNLTRWDPFDRALSWREVMNRLFDESLAPSWPLVESRVRSLALDVRETDESLVIEGSLPGVKPEDIDISVAGSILTIKGETKEEKKEEKGNYHYHERRYGAYQRSITLPVDVDVDKAESAFENGVLKLTLPKVEASKAKRIPVKS